MEIQTKFNGGETAFFVTTRWGQELVPCEPCGGTGSVAVVTQKESYPAHCPYCNDFGINSVPGRVPKYRYQPVVQKLTIGRVNVSVEFDRVGCVSRVVEERYMAFETGVGSGSLYDAENLFRDEREARACAEERAKEAQLVYERREEIRVAKAAKKVLRKKGG